MSGQAPLSATQETLLKTLVERAHGSAEPFIIAAIDDGHDEVRFGTNGDQRDDFARDVALANLKVLEKQESLFIAKDESANIVFMLTLKASERLPSAAKNE